ncbi:MAG: diphthine synthase [Candidatus Aenigmarchaeota archaeon]|nr:diphthine synthase [Candidatus Aenigmarchaeota archaeon]
MLYLIGIGLSPADLTVGGIEAGKAADELYIEQYTSLWKGSAADIEKAMGKKPVLLKRKGLEDDSVLLVERAKEKNIAVLIIGDPLSATTHMELLLECKKQSVPCKVFHSVSIFSVIAETGLQLYKFGRTATIPFTGQLTAVKETIEGNKKLGLHTLLLLDLDSEVNLYMGPVDALKFLLKAKITKPAEKFVAAAALGTPEQTIVYAPVKELLEKRFPYPAVLILPGKLHFKEKEALETYSK